MSANKEGVIRQFCDVTGADEDRSKFFLESSNWQLEVALSSFYEHGGNVEDAPANVAAPDPPQVFALSDSDMESPPASPVKTKKKDKETKNRTNSNFATLNSILHDSSSDEEEVPKAGWIGNKVRGIIQVFMNNEPGCSKNYLEKGEQSTQCQSDTVDCKDTVRELEEENDRLRREIDVLKGENIRLTEQIDERKKSASTEGEAFYAGGSERSGQQILGPPGKSRKDIVTEMFKSVRERGAVAFEDEPQTGSRQAGAFSGTGYRLGQTADDHEEVTPPTLHGQTEVRSVRLRLYREGFTVDSGPLRLYTDAANAEFLGSIRRGEIPSELSSAGGAGGAEVRVSLEDRRQEECPRGGGGGARGPAFAGVGHLLGSPAPVTVGTVTPAAPAAPAAPDTGVHCRAAQGAVALDEERPVTTIQFRLADGTRITGRFNHSHTVADLRQYLTTAAPASRFQNFVLMTTFPSAELTDPAITLEQAKLLNSVIVQRVK